LHPFISDTFFLDIVAGEEADQRAVIDREAQDIADPVAALRQGHDRMIAAAAQDLDIRVFGRQAVEGHILNPERQNAALHKAPIFGDRRFPAYVLGNLTVRDRGLGFDFDQFIFQHEGILKSAGQCASMQGFASE